MEELLDSLRGDLIRKCGLISVYPKDCVFLSSEIRKATGRSVSPTTLKRFFRIIFHNHNTSRYVLDTFSIYLGFDSWNDYLNSFDKKKHAYKKDNSWELLRKRINPVTRSSLNSIKLKIGYNKKKFIPRPFANKSFSAFYRSDKTITALVAPQGYGKSSILVQLIDSWFLGDHAFSPHDIICLIDGEMFINILSNNLGVELLEQFIDFDLDKSLLRVFSADQKSIEGHIIIIIDDVDEIYYQDDKFHDFAGNLMKMVMAYAGKDWFKVLITFKPENLKVFSYFIERYPALKAQWFGMPFSAESNENINIPLFNEEEVRDIMRLNNFLLPIESLHYYHYDMIRAIKYPYLLFSLIELNKHNVLVSELELIEDYVRGKITSGAYGSEKQEIILSFLRLCDYGEKSGSVRKKSLPLENQNKIAYDELVSFGIICEMQIQETYLYRTVYCRFLNNNLFNYITALHWISNYGINLRLFKKLNAHYQYNLPLKLNIYNFLIKAAIKEGNLGFLKQVHCHIEEKQVTESDKRNKISISLYKDLAVTISLELRNFREHRNEMMRFYAATQLGRSLFYENNLDLDSVVLYSAENYKYYLENTNEPVSSVYANFMNFLKGFLSGNDSVCHSVYEMNRQFDRAALNHPVAAGFSDAVSIIYQSCIFKYARILTIDEIIGVSRNLISSEVNEGLKKPVYEFTVLLSLNYTDRFDDMIRLVKHIQSAYDLSRLTSSFFYQYHLLCYARALLHTGNPEKAIQIYQQYETTEVPPLMKYYMLISKYFIDIDFLLYEGKSHEAMLLIENIRNISRMLQFKYSFAIADKLRNQLRRSPDWVISN